MAAVFNPGVNVASALDESLKPPAAAACAAPRVSPVSVMVIAAVPVAAQQPVVSTIVVLVGVAAVYDIAVKVGTVLEMEATVPKK